MPPKPRCRPATNTARRENRTNSTRPVVTSVMVDLVEGKTVDEAMKLAETFHKLMESRGKGLNDEQAEESLEDGIVFQGVSQYPMRIKCALLGWEGMKDAVAKALAAKA